MQKNKSYLKIKTPIALVFLALLALTSIASGYLFANKNGQVAGTKSTAKATANLEIDKVDTPQLQFFVMSFCPYGNQIETALKPVADLLGDEANIQPQYIFDKIDGDLATYCQQRVPDASRCQDYVDAGQVASVAECQSIIASQLESCQDDSQYMKIDDSYYSSLHGRVEANQNVREICAWNQTGDKSVWWNFIENVNLNCTAENADTCWQDQANSAGLNTDKITDCFNNQAKQLIEKEIAETVKYNASASPTLILNGVQIPPEAAYAQDGSAVLGINGVNITQANYRTPEGLKQAVCSIFSKQPKDCKTTLESGAETAAPSAGGC